MPFNLLKNYNQLLDFGAMNEYQRGKSLLAIFNRDIAENEAFSFWGKRIIPTPKDGKDKMEILFTHLTCVIVDKITRKREFDINRSCRLHWIRFHVEQKKKENVVVFSVDEPDGNRTYIYDIDEKYVVVLEPLRELNQYYLLSAYHLTGKDAKRDKIMRKYKIRRLPHVL